MNHDGVTDNGEVTLWIPDAAAHQLINSSQTANDTRQILRSAGKRIDTARIML